MPDDSDILLQEYFGPLDPSWIIDTTTVPARRVVTVPLTKLYADPLYGKPRGVKYDQGLAAWIKLPLFSAVTGGPVVVDVGAYSVEPTIAARIMEATGADPNVFEPDVAAELADGGRAVQFAVPPEVADAAGVYRAQVRVVDGTGVERARDEFHILVDRGFWTTTGDLSGQKGPPTVAEIRTALRDHPGANRLLGDFDFDAAELAYALVSAVQHYNSAFPPLPRALTTVTWPTAWRRPWLDGALAYLFDTAAAYQRRGHLPYQAGGVAIDDLAKEKDYLAAANVLRQKFEQWVKSVRAMTSLNAAWGSVGGGLTAPTY